MKTIGNEEGFDDSKRRHYVCHGGRSKHKQNQGRNDQHSQGLTYQTDLICPPQNKSEFITSFNLWNHSREGVLVISAPTLYSCWWSGTQIPRLPESFLAFEQHTEYLKTTEIVTFSTVCIWYKTEIWANVVVYLLLPSFPLSQQLETAIFQFLQKSHQKLYFLYEFFPFFLSVCVCFHSRIFKKLQNSTNETYPSLGRKTE